MLGSEPCKLRPVYKWKCCNCKWNEPIFFPSSMVLLFRNSNRAFSVVKSGYTPMMWPLYCQWWLNGNVVVELHHCHPRREYDADKAHIGLSHPRKIHPQGLLVSEYYYFPSHFCSNHRPTKASYPPSPPPVQSNQSQSLVQLYLRRSVSGLWL